MCNVLDLCEYEENQLVGGACGSGARCVSRSRRFGRRIMYVRPRLFVEGMQVRPLLFLLSILCLNKHHDGAK